MIRINLLREKIQKPPSLMWQFWVYVATVVLVLGMVGYIGWNQKQNINELRREKARLDREIKLYEKYDKLVKEIDAKLAEIKRRQQIVRELVSDKDYAVRTLALIAILTANDSMWLESLGYNNGLVNLTGYAKSDETIVDFIRNLESSQYVLKDSVSLVRSRTEAYAGRPLKKFEMQVQVLPFSRITASKGSNVEQLSSK